MGRPFDGISFEKLEPLRIAGFLSVVNQRHSFTHHDNTMAVSSPSPNCSNSVPSLIIRQSTDPAIVRPNQEREIKLN